MAKNKWLKMLQKDLKGLVDRDYNPYMNVVRSHSPSVNFTFGNTHGLPLGYSAVIYGPPKSGKSILCNSFVGQLHLDDPDAVAIKFNTELREEGQVTPRQAKIYGIDFDRYDAYNTNKPDEIFDMIETQINAAAQKGAPIKLIIIDSVNGILGRRAMNNEKGIMQQQMGDEAATLGTGLKQILTTIRHNRIALILTAHVRSEMDPNKAKYNPTKMAAAWALKHFAEYFINITPNNSAEGKKDMAGQAFVDKSLKDMKDNPELTGGKIRVAMKDSSVGPKGRVGEFTLDYSNGIVNTNEEVFMLASRRKIVERPNNKTFIVKDFPVKGEDQKFIGKDDFATAIANNEDLAKELIKRVRAQDIETMEHGRTVIVGNTNMVEDEDSDLLDTGKIDEEDFAE